MTVLINTIREILCGLLMGHHPDLEDNGYVYCTRCGKMIIGRENANNTKGL